MKFLVFALSVIVVFSVSFAEGDKAKMSLEDRKAKVTGHIDKRIASLNEFKTCVSGVTEKGGIKTCRKANKQRMAKIKEEQKAMKGK